MWPVSQRFLDALTQSHVLATRVDVWRGGVKLETDIPIAGGSVSVDESSQVRRTLSLEVADPSLDPVNTDSLLTPFGSELHVRTGIRYPEGDTELVPVGVFGIESVSRGGVGETTSVNATDRARAVAEYRLLRPLNIAADRPVVDYIAEIVHYVNASWDVYDLTNSSEYTNAVTVESERWDAIELLADSIGAEVFFDPEGVCIIREVPTDLTEESVWSVAAGDLGTLGDVATGINRERVYNGVVATGETQDETPPPTSFVYQKSGPFRWGGPFGKVPRFYASPLLKTTNQTRLAAGTILARSTGYAQRITPTVIRNPALDVGDVITVVMPDGTNHVQIVSKLSFSLGSDEAGMTVETRTSADRGETEDFEGM